MLVEPKINSHCAELCFYSDTARVSHSLLSRDLQKVQQCYICTHNHTHIPNNSNCKSIHTNRLLTRKQNFSLIFAVKGPFTLNTNACVYFFENSGSNGNKTQLQGRGSVAILCVNINVPTDTMFKFDVNADANIDGKCERTLSRCKCYTGFPKKSDVAFAIVYYERSLRSFIRNSFLNDVPC